MSFHHDQQPTHPQSYETMAELEASRALESAFFVKIWGSSEIKWLKRSSRARKVFMTRLGFGR